MASTHKKEPQDTKTKRLAEWRNWIKTFRATSSVINLGDFKTIPYAAEILNDYYWRLIDNSLKPLLKEHDRKLNYYKIISASELTVMAVMPFNFTKEESRDNRKILNSEFACHVALSILLSWEVDGKKINDASSIKKIISHHEVINVVEGTEVRLTSNFLDEHIDWLRYVNTTGPLPVLSNSQTWRMMVLATKALNDEIT